MGYRIVDATEHHGTYIEDDYGRTVCDFYYMNPQRKRQDPLPYAPFHNATKNAVNICAALNVE